MKYFVLIFVTVFSLNDLEASNKNLENIEDSIGFLKKPTKKNSKKGNSTKSYTFSNPYKISTLCRLIQLGNYKAVKNCIENGYNINQVSYKLTPVMYAARHNRTAILKLLIDNGANLKVRSKNGRTALKWAKQTNAKEAYALISRELKK